MEEKPKLAGRSKLRGRRLLVVDDDPHAQRSVCRLLRACDAKVETAANVDEALQRIEESSPFDAAIVDFFLVDQVGLEIVTALRQGKQPTCALMITADTRQQRCNEAISAGADDFLIKPFQVEDLVRSVGMTIERTHRWRARLGHQAERPPAGLRGAVKNPYVFGRPDVHAFLDELCLRGDLSRREREVLEQMLMGKRNKDAGRAIGVTERTIKYHMTHILKKVGVQSRGELLSLVFQERPTEQSA